MGFRIKKELIAKKVSNWQSYFQNEELNILEMAELQEILGRGKEEEEEEDDYVSDDIEIMEEGSPERPLVQGKGRCCNDFQHCRLTYMVFRSARGGGQGNPKGRPI